MANPLPTDEIGKNIKAARDKMKWSQGDLARAIKVSVQAISQWETGKTLPAIDSIMDAAAAMDIHPGAILWGEKYLETLVGPETALEDVQGGWGDVFRVPIISWDSVETFILDHDRAGTLKRGVQGYLVPTAAESYHAAFALEIFDNSMEPEFRKGDHILVDATRRITPGALVVAITPKQKQVPHISPHSTTILRRVQMRYQGKKRVPVINLVASNPDFPSIEMAGDSFEDGWVAGTVVEHRHYQFSDKDFLLDVYEDAYLNRKPDRDSPDQS